MAEKKKSNVRVTKTTNAPVAEEERQRAFYDCPAEDFIRIWQESSSVQEVVQKTAMPYDIVLARVSGYRRKGINLKKMKRASSSRKLDVKHINELIAEQMSKKKPSAEHIIDQVLPAVVKTLERRLADILDAK